METPIYRLPPFTVEAQFVSLSETVDWGLHLYGIPQAWASTKGEGICVAVLDTGCQLDHPDLNGAIVGSQDFTRSPIGPLDGQGHGTHCAGTIAARKNGIGVVGVAPKCSLLIGKVLGDSGSGSDDWVAAGIRWAVKQGADVISMSLGSPSESTAIRMAIIDAVESGVFVICAAGNDGRDNSVNYPARFPESIAVAAVDRHGRVARFSSRGPEVDIAAPGQDILSTYIGSHYAKLSGTSMATPFASGVVALMLSKHRQDAGDSPIRTVPELREHLSRTARDAGSTGHDPAYGYGLIDPAKMLEPIVVGVDPAQPEAESEGVTIFIPGAKVVQ